MAKVQVTKTWTITPNLRYTPFVSLTANMGWWLYRNKTATLAAGWTLIGTSNGAAAAFDGAGGDRWTSDSVGTVTIGAAAANPQSWAILQNADGVQVLLAYQGATADICRVSMSQGGLFVIAGTVTHQPTATDEVILTTGTTVIGATASADRVMSIGCTTEQWWSVNFRAGALNMYTSVDKIDSAVDTTVLARPYVATKLTAGLTAASVLRGSVMAGHRSDVGLVGTAAHAGPTTRVVTGGTGRIIRIGGGARTAPMTTTGATQELQAQAIGPGDYTAWASCPSGYTAATPPALNNGTIPIFTIDWFGEKTANMDGYLGSPIDWWYAHTAAAATPAIGDFVAALAPGDTQATALRSNWLVSLGSAVIRPWLNAAATLQIT